MTLTAIVLWLVIGAVAGWLAGQLMRGRGLGLVGNIVVGISGAFVGGWLLGGVLSSLHRRRPDRRHPQRHCPALWWCLR